MGDSGGQQQLTVVEGHLKATGDAIDGIVDGLGGGTVAMTGQGFQDVGLDFVEAGKESVQKSSERFAEKWSWGVRNLVKSAAAIARTLDLSETRYVQEDERMSGAAKVIVNSAAGNPYLTEDEVTAMSWGELGSNMMDAAVSYETPEQTLQQVTEAGQNFLTTAEVVGPQAASNLMFVSSLPMTAFSLTDANPLPSPGWNTDATERLAEARAADGS